MSRRGDGVHKLAGSGRAKPWVAVLPLPNGKRLTRYASTQKDAIELLQELRAELDAQGTVTPARLTVGGYLTERWLPHVEKQVRPKTFRLYSMFVHHTFVKYLGKIPLAQLNASHVEAMMDKRKGQVSGGTVALERECLRNALNRAIDWDIISKNAAAKAAAPKRDQERREIQPFDQDELKRFLEAIRGDRFEALYVLALSTGLRQGEALGLTWEDLDLDRGILRVRMQLQRDGDGVLGRAKPKTEKSRRDLPLLPEVVVLLRGHREAQTVRSLDGYVFTASSGQPLDGVNVTHRFQRVLKRAGLRTMRFHDLRHSAAAMLRAQGAPLDYVSRVLGHSDVRLTANIYMHYGEELNRDMAERMSRALGYSAESK